MRKGTPLTTVLLLSAPLMTFVALVSCDRKESHSKSSIERTQDDDALIRNLGHGDYGVRQEAVKAISSKGLSPNRISQLITSINEPKKDSYFRRSAVEVLGLMLAKDAIPQLVVALKDKDPLIRGEAATALDRLGWKPSDQRAYIDYYIAARKWYELRQMGSVAVLPLLFYLLDGEDGGNGVTFKWEAAQTLDQIGDPRARIRLVEALRDPDFDRRYSAVQAMIVMRVPDALKRLIALLGEKNEAPVIRHAVVRALGHLGDPRAVAPLIEALGDGDEFVSSEASDSLVSLEAPNKMGLLVKKLTDWFSSQRAAITLERLGWKPASESDRIHHLAARRSTNELRAEWDTAKLVLLKDVESRDSVAVHNAVYALIGIGKDEVVPILARTLRAKGDKRMAEVYLNSGHPTLAQEGRHWAERNAYSISEGGGNIPVSWGRL